MGKKPVPLFYLPITILDFSIKMAKIRTIAAKLAGEKHGERCQVENFVRRETREAPPSWRKNGGNTGMIYRCGEIRKCCHKCEKEKTYFRDTERQRFGGQGKHTPFHRAILARDGIKR
jgi:hypothetical protein